MFPTFWLWLFLGEVWFLNFLSIVGLVENHLRFFRVKPIPCKFTTVSDVNTKPLFVMINEMPSAPD